MQAVFGTLAYILETNYALFTSVLGCGRTAIQTIAAVSFSIQQWMIEGYGIISTILTDTIATLVICAKVISRVLAVTIALIQALFTALETVAFTVS